MRELRDVLEKFMSATLSATTQYVDAGNIRYAYRSLGPETGAPLLCLQHFTGTLDLWDPAVFDKLSESRRILFFENAGVGLSTGTTPNTVEAMAGHAVHFLEVLGISQVDILGFSLGGFLAQHIALVRPEMVRRLILSGTGPEGGEGVSMGRPELLKVFSDATMPMPDKLKRLFFTGSEASQAAAAAYLSRVAQRQPDRDTNATAEVAMNQLQAMAAWETARDSAWKKLHTINHPALVTNGNNDTMIPTPNSFVLSQQLPNATLIVYPDSGHGALYQYPELFVAHVKAFLDL